MTLKKTEKDIDGNVVESGDIIRFCYGFLPIAVEGTLIERNGKLILPTPSHTPKEATLGQLRYHCGGFSKVQESTP